MTSVYFFFFNDTATTEIYTLSLHDALPISISTASASTTLSPSMATRMWPISQIARSSACRRYRGSSKCSRGDSRSEEHTSELQSRQYLVCRLLLEKKKKIINIFASL